MQVDEGTTVYGYLHLATPEDPVLLFFHGNGEIAVDYDLFARCFTQAGTSFLVMDYRGYGRSDGKPSTSNMLSDAVTIFDSIPKLLPAAYQQTPIFVMGRSLGGASALEVADKRQAKVAGLVLESAFAFSQPLLDRQGLALDGYDEERDGHGNASKIAHYTGRTLILHGKEDRLIPAEEANTLYRLSGAVDKRLVVIPDVGHNDLMMGGLVPYFAAVKSFIASGRLKEV